jgi:hypothetical protein
MKINLVDENNEIFDSVEIPDNTSVDLSENQGGFLDQRICREFRETISFSPKLLIRTAFYFDRQHELRLF